SRCVVPALMNQSRHTMRGRGSGLNALCTLRIGERIVTRCNDGLLEAEYALFTRSETLLARTNPVEVREIGYFTTAADARERLAAAGVDGGLAGKCLVALGGERIRAFARSGWVADIADRLGAHEVFEGSIYHGGRYFGAWLDLDVLAQACGVAWASVAMQ